MAHSVPKAAGIYCRLSYADDGTEEKVERQEADARQVGDRLAWPISEPHVWKDNNRSAWQRNRKRPGWDAMLKAIEAGEIDAVIVYHGDRLLRQPFDLEKLISVAESKQIRIASVTGTRNLDNADDRYILRIEAAGFCRASDDSSRRVRRAQAALKAAGLPRPGGTRAFGFERDNITIRRAESEILSEAADRLLAGQSTYGVMRWANTVSTTSTGKPWRTNVLKDVLRRPRTAGFLDVDGELVKAPWDPIIDPDAWLDLRSLLNARRDAYLEQPRAYVPNGAGEYAVRYLLTGIARCGTCGGPMRAQMGWLAGKTRERRTYLCGDNSCTYRVGRDMKHLDTYVVGRTLGILNDKAFIDSLHADLERPGLAAEISQLEQRKAVAKEQLENLAEQGVEVDPVSLAKSIGSFDKKIDELRDRRTASRRQRLLARMTGMTPGRWEAEPLDVKRSTIAALFTIEVLPATRKGSGFDPAGVRVELIQQG